MMIGASDLPFWSFNAADNNGMVLSNTNRTAAGSNNDGVRGNRPMSTGKHYFEVELVTASVLGGVGIADLSAGPGGPLGNQGNSIGWRHGDGAIWFQGAVVATYTIPAFGDVIGIAVDMAARQMWFARNNAWQGGSNPATGTLGVSFAATGDHYPQVVSGTFTITYPRRYLPPTGFSPL